MRVQGVSAVSMTVRADSAPRQGEGVCSSCTTAYYKEFWPKSQYGPTT